MSNRSFMMAMKAVNKVAGLPECYWLDFRINHSLPTENNDFVQYKSRDYIPYSYFFVMMRLIG
jgi:hypothetical protein